VSLSLFISLTVIAELQTKPAEPVLDLVTKRHESETVIPEEGRKRGREEGRKRGREKERKRGREEERKRGREEEHILY
jgi:predicted transposase YdaD